MYRHIIIIIYLLLYYSFIIISIINPSFLVFWYFNSGKALRCRDARVLLNDMHLDFGTCFGDFELLEAHCALDLLLLLFHSGRDTPSLVSDAICDILIERLKEIYKINNSIRKCNYGMI